MRYINKKRLIETFVELAIIPSPSGQEEAIIQVLRDKLNHLGLGQAFFLLDDNLNKIKRRIGFAFFYPASIMRKHYLSRCDPP